MRPAHAVASFAVLAVLSSCGRDSIRPAGAAGEGGGGAAGQSERSGSGGAGGRGERIGYGGAAGQGEPSGFDGGAGADAPHRPSSCGNGVLDEGEVCDDGAANGAGYVTRPDGAGAAGCSVSCERPHYCGDGMVDSDAGEQCDFGPDNGRYLDVGAAKCVVCDVDCLLLLDHCYWPGEFPPASDP